MEHEPLQPHTPYEDPELIEQAGGDRLLLDRLVAVRITGEMVAADPANESLQRAFETMQEELRNYQEKSQSRPQEP